MTDHRQTLLEVLAAHPCADEAEAADVRFITDFVGANADCFGKANPVAHITGSAIVVDPAGRLLLTHHAKLKRWLQVGGHSDPDEYDPARTALREAQEESGLADLELVQAAPIDVDAHLIPARKSEAAHHHLDFRYLLRTQTPESIVCTEESAELAWFHTDALADLGFDAALWRALRKVFPDLE